MEKINPDDILLEDIAHSLSLICRGCGHTGIFYSVAQHCMECAKEAMARTNDRNLALLCLLHDASECYLSDLPSPVKEALPDYQNLEKNLMDVIYQKFYGEIPSEDLLKMVWKIDNDLKMWDLKFLVGKEENLPNLFHEIFYEERNHKDVEEDFLNLLQNLDPKALAR